MNIELIIKLAKLANNNPNDNEANAASRKVCRLIEEGNFQFIRTTAEKVGAEQAKGPWQYDQRYRYEDLQEMINNMFGGGFRPSDRQRQYYKTGPIEYTKEAPHQDNTYYQKKHDVQYNRNPFTGEKIPRDVPKRPLQCKTCKQEIMTGFVGVPQMFECNKCIWQAYKESK